jgi:antitoxin (DNA-binding transcriptional repressor) of toxin-antitoxin stability system
MCYMSTVQRAEVLVGVRELRQNLSVYLARLSAGTVFRVTDRGKAVALLIPLPAETSTVERLVAAGRATPPKQNLLALGAPTTKTTASVSKALREMREDRL